MQTQRETVQKFDQQIGEENFASKLNECVAFRNFSCMYSYSFSLGSQLNYAVTNEKKTESIIVIGESHPISCRFVRSVIARSASFICS